MPKGVLTQGRWGSYSGVPKGVLTQGLWGSYFLPRLGLRGSFHPRRARAPENNNSPRNYYFPAGVPLPQEGSYWNVLVAILTAQDGSRWLKLGSHFGSSWAQTDRETPLGKQRTNAGRALWQTEITGGLCGGADLVGEVEAAIKKIGRPLSPVLLASLPLW